MAVLSTIQTRAHGGTGSISGTVTVNGAQAQKRVLLFERGCNRPVRETISAADGSYSFAALDTSKKFYVVSLDDTASYNAKIADHLTPA